MRSGARSSGGVSEHDRRSDQTHKHGTSNGTGVARMTPVNAPERVNELRDGVTRPFNATRERRRGSTSEIPAKKLTLAPTMGYTPGSKHAARWLDRWRSAVLSRRQ